MVSAAKSSGLICARDPRFAFPTGVLAPATITASFIIQLSLLIINYAKVFLSLTYVAFFVVSVAHQLGLKMPHVLNRASLAHQSMFLLEFFHPKEHMLIFLRF